MHEAYLKLVDQRRVHWQNRAHFFAIAAHIMRRILVDHARVHGAAKRGGGAAVSLTDVDAGIDPADTDLLALDAALNKLARIDSRESRLVELRFFGGLSVEETAAVLDIAAITVKRDWVLARTWLYRESWGVLRDDHARQLGADPRSVPPRPGAPCRGACGVSAS